MVTMTPQEYHQLRETLGSQKEVSQRLGVNIRTVQRRETGEILITEEAVRSLNALTVLGKLVQIAASMRDGSVKQELIALGNLLQQTN
jgi:DNA-binding transcriptional regulator YiaG